MRTLTFHARIIPIYLDKPPDTVALDTGVNIGISRAALNVMYIEAYKATLDAIPILITLR